VYADADEELEEAESLEEMESYEEEVPTALASSGPMTDSGDDGEIAQSLEELRQAEAGEEDEE